CFAMENYFYNGALRSDINLYAPLCVLTLIFVFVFVTAKKMTDFYEMELSMLKMQEDLNHSQISIMLSQIRPHFLYNALTAIQCLCRTDPAKAEKALIQFSRYLRANLSAINSQEYIPFTEELNHIENYLAIEKLRFGDRLEIIYEIEEADFVVPVLSIQPIVENAVKHGVSKKLDEGYVIIASRKVNNGYEITVTDNGVGFDTTKNIDEKSYGMRNITSRIKAMNNSTIKFNSKIGEGTEVVVTINT
ncbi:MAG: histidine kinase, partial [Oscillospiraceae bacterium]|nr:histidine kinase [Oscillospiraceae bacterium]